MKMISTNPSTDGNKVKAGGCGAIRMILSAMDAHMKNPGVCEQGCRALISITYNNGKQQPQSKDNFEWKLFPQTKQ